MFALVVKTAATRAAKEYRAEAVRQGLSVPKSMAPGQTLWETVQAGMSNAPPGSRFERLQSLVPGMEATGYGTPWQMGQSRADRISNWAGQYAGRIPQRPGPGPSFVSGEGPAWVERALRDRASGRHPGKPGEVMIPSTGIVNLTAGAPKSDFLFRGNIPQISNNGWVADAQGTPGVLTSRHPEVAASYASGPTRGGQTAPSGRMFAFPRNVPGSWGSDAPDTNLTTRPELADAVKADRLAKQRRLAAQPVGKPVARMTGAGFNGRFEPSTFEDLVPHTSLDFNKPAGEYAVRASRMADGTPAFAVRDVSGVPAMRAFPGATKIPEAVPPTAGGRFSNAITAGARRLAPLFKHFRK